MFYVYAVFNRKHNKIYIGQTVNLEERIKMHNDKLFSRSYTARFDGEWKLVYKEMMAIREEVLEREKQLKSYRGRQFIKSNIPR